MRIFYLTIAFAIALGLSWQAHSSELTQTWLVADSDRQLIARIAQERRSRPHP